VSELRPTLIFDGDCGICRTWVDYWGQLTGDPVVYRPYQEAAKDFPRIPLDEFKRAMQLVEPDGNTYAGAAATFRLLTYAPARSWWWLYRYLPGFAPVSEAAYSFLSKRRGVLAAITRILWGPTLEPESYALVSWLFLRGLGAIYVAAFVSLAVQISGLVGHDGITPLDRYLPAAHGAWGTAAYWRLPTLFWLDQSDTALIAGAWLGAALGTLALLGVLVRPALIALFVLYLSYTYAGQLFLNFQWDQLLLESGFLAIFLTGGTRIVLWLYRLLVFRFLFLAGIVKLVSGDASWRSLTALQYHFWTQPLPTPLAWYAAQLPDWLLSALTGLTLVVELVVVFMIFLPRRPRAIVGILALLFQLGITLTGNYNFFNLLTMLLCLFLFDDQQLCRAFPQDLVVRIKAKAPQPGTAATLLASLLALIGVPVGLDIMVEPFTKHHLQVIGSLTEAIAPLAIVNRYGVFAVMTTTRPEIIFEGSDDKRNWRAYEFRYKAGPLDRPLKWNIPHQPRLDWQLWFAALDAEAQNRWVEGLLLRLLQGSPQVLALLPANPFPDHPPAYVRSLVYDYRFSDPKLRAETGQVWVRQPLGIYFPPVSLDDFASAAR
jgi:predicted DCC family thiol-disulfide oxidoreductase YuxK